MSTQNKFHIILFVIVLLASTLACQLVTFGLPKSDAQDTNPTVIEETKSQDEPTVAVVETKESPTEVVEEEEPQMEVVKEEEPQIEVIRQWAIFASASSEYDDPDWSAFQATGAPESIECGDMPNAWASAEPTSVDWLELLYEKPVIPDQINIYQNNLPDQVVRVEVIDPDLNYYTVYTGKPSITECPYTLTVNVYDIDFLVAGVKITVDQSILGSSWDEIDAVELVGRYPGENVAVEEQPVSSPAISSSNPSGNYTLPEMSPTSLTPGTFYYEVVGDSQDATIDKGTLQDQSTTEEYVIGFVSDNFRYAVSLFIPLDVAPGTLNFGKYDRSTFKKSPNAAIYIGSGYYYADGGVIMIESVENNLITGRFIFVGTSEYDESRKVTVSGVFNQYPLTNK